jgi:hypothetical protein
MEFFFKIYFVSATDSLEVLRMPQISMYEDFYLQLLGLVFHEMMK